MMRWKWAACCAMLLGGSPTAFCQVVQLPTFHYFSVATTVLVPDRGSMMIGGVDRASFGSSTAGVPGLGGIPGAGRLFKNGAIGSEVRTSRLDATATIIDLNELDQAVLAEAEARRGQSATDPAVARKAAFLARHIARPDKSLAEDATSRGSLATAARVQPTTLRDGESEAREAFQIAQQAESKGQLATARINYKRAAILSRGTLRAAAEARLAAVSASATRPMSTSR